MLLDRALAALYGVETKILNRAVRRNIDRFPADFMFTLTREEAQRSRFQFGILNAKQRGTISNTGRSLSPKAVAQAIELSDTKYCSVADTLRPKVEIQSTFEIIEEPLQPVGE